VLKTFRSLIKVLLFPLGVALIFAAWYSQEGTALSVSLTATIVPTPTIDRLAKPTLPAVPSQADYGAQAFWLYCLPCHGDKGQGLTDEFRQTYPPDHQNCWESGCHGKRPYPNGWTLPPIVPRLIGDGALNNFPNAATLHGFISADMPFQSPGTLSDTLSWQLTAFLLRQNGLWDGQSEVNTSNAAQIVIFQSAMPVPSATPFPTPQVSSPIPESQSGYSISLVFIVIGLAILVLIVLIILHAKVR